MAQVARCQQAVLQVPLVGVGVALEQHPVRDQDPAGTPDRKRSARVRHDGHLGTVRRPARRVGCPPQLLRGRDAHPGRLGGAVEVVEDVAVPVHEPGGQATG